MIRSKRLAPTQLDTDDDLELFNGTHEMGAYTREADLVKLNQNCKKNPGHVNFIPVNQFSIRDLPDGYHDDDVCQLIRATAKITIQLKVSFTSLDRPRTYPGTNITYPFYGHRGTRLSRTGTGRVDQVTMYRPHHRQKCPCTKCKISGNPKMEWGQIEVHTATHVVFDDTEAAKTVCRFFYEDNANAKEVTESRAAYLEEAKIEEDRCRVKFVSCDLDLLKELDARRLECRDVCKSVNEKYRSCEDTHRLTVIVSHPHGQPMQVSIGEWTHKKKLGKAYTRYVYNTPTCPGSSGAHTSTKADERTEHAMLFNHQVCILGSYDSWWCNHVHSGTSPHGANYSNTGRDLDVPQPKQSRVLHEPPPRPDDTAPSRQRRLALAGLNMYYKSMELKRPIAVEDYEDYNSFINSKTLSQTSASGSGGLI